MTKEEFNRLGVGIILLTGNNYIKITNINKDCGTFDGELYVSYPLNVKPISLKGRSWVEVDFFDIPTEKFVTDCIKIGHKVKFDTEDELTVSLCDTQGNITESIDVICKYGLVKYFSIPDVAIPFIGSAITQYKNIKK